jgi:putative endonuclease
MNYFVYILFSLKDHKFYTGLTNNIERRLEEHNRGNYGTPTTLNRGPFSLIHAEEAISLTEARKREKYWKSGQGREVRDIIAKKISWVASSVG